jgi:hypothetical protein
MWASLGINAYMPHILYKLNFPFIGYFRQWYHFLPLVNLCLSALGALGFSALFSRLKWAGTGRVVAGIAVILAVFAVMYHEGSSYFGQYVRGKLFHMSHRVEKLSKDEFINLMRGGQFERGLLSLRFQIDYAPPRHMVYKEWFRLSRACPEALINSPYIAGAVYNDTDVPSQRMGSLIKAFCESDLVERAVLAGIPVSKAGVPSVRLPNILHIGYGSFPEPGRQSMGNLIIPAEDYLVTPSGAALRGMYPEPALVVFPFSHKLGFGAEVNGQKVDTYPVYGGAYTGVAVPAGNFIIYLSVPFSGYQAALIAQAALLLFIIVFSSFLLFRRESIGNINM